VHERRCTRFREAELEEVYADAAKRDQRLADLLLIDAWTGLRWSELRAIRVRDFVDVPLPLLIGQRAAPEGVRVKVTKSGLARLNDRGEHRADMGE
jgi:integrase